MDGSRFSICLTSLILSLIKVMQISIMSGSFLTINDCIFPLFRHFNSQMELEIAFESNNNQVGKVTCQTLLLMQMK